MEIVGLAIGAAVVVGLLFIVMVLNVRFLLALWRLIVALVRTLLGRPDGQT